MYKRLTALLTVVLCMALIVALGMTAMATEPDGTDVSDSSVTSSEASTDSSGDSSSESTESEVGSDVASGDETSSGDEISSSDETSSGDENSSETDGTSSATTSSKVNKPIYSDGGNGGNTFIEQDPSQLASQNASTVVNSVASDEPISSEYVETDEEIDYYQTKTKRFSDGIVGYIWIPIGVSIVCITALIVVNVMFKKKYPKKSKAGATRRDKGSHAERPQRRK